MINKVNVAKMWSLIFEVLEIYLIFSLQTQIKKFWENLGAKISGELFSKNNWLTSN